MPESEHPEVDGSDYSRLLAGHLGHLTSSQEKSLETFKQSLHKADLYNPRADDNGRPSHDDTTLLRFLRARKFDVDKAHVQFAETSSWRAEHDVDNLYATFDPEEMESAKRFYPRWTGRRDKLGIPVYVYRLASLEPLSKEIFAVKPERRYQRIVALWEFMGRFSHPLCSHLPRPTSPTPICSTVSIIDFDSVSFKSLWSLRGHLQEASALATANYPETLHTIAVVNTPSFFPTVWGWIKNWFDEGTRNKVHVLGRDPGPELRKFIDNENIPKAYGGELDFKFEDEPNLDQAARDVVGEMPKGPVTFWNGVVVRPREGKFAS